MNATTEVSTGIKAAIAVAGGSIATWFGGVWPMLAMVIGFLVFDYLTGMLAAGKNHSINSRRGTQGLWKKLGTLLLMVLGLALDVVIPTFVSNGLDLDLGFQMPFGLIFCAWIIINESISIIENLVECEVQVPVFFTKLLKITADKLNQGDGGVPKGD